MSLDLREQVGTPGCNYCDEMQRKVTVSDLAQHASASLCSAAMLPYEPIGLDLSLTSTGIAVGNETWAISPKGLKGPQRLVYLRDQIIETLEQRSDYISPHNGIIVIIEGYSFG